MTKITLVIAILVVQRKKCQGPSPSMKDPTSFGGKDLELFCDCILDHLFCGVDDLSFLVRGDH